MNIKIFFGLYADRSEESFHKAFLTLLRESKDIADLRGIVRGVSEFPELLKGKERDFIFLLDKAVTNFDPGTDKDARYRKVIYSFLPIFEFPVMQEFLFRVAGSTWDINFAKKMLKLFGIAHANLGSSDVGHFFLEVLPKLAREYPLTMRAIYTEIRIHNRNVLNSGNTLSDLWIQLEELYETLQKKH